jgi:hypothetical protein
MRRASGTARVATLWIVAAALGAAAVVLGAAPRSAAAVTAYVNVKAGTRSASYGECDGRFGMASGFNSSNEWWPIDANCYSTWYSTAGGNRDVDIKAEIFWGGEYIWDSCSVSTSCRTSPGGTCANATAKGACVISGNQILCPYTLWYDAGAIHDYYFVMNYRQRVWYNQRYDYSPTGAAPTTPPADITSGWIEKEASRTATCPDLSGQSFLCTSYTATGSIANCSATPCAYTGPVTFALNSGTDVTFHYARAHNRTVALEADVGTPPLQGALYNNSGVNITGSAGLSPGLGTQFVADGSSSLSANATVDILAGSSRYLLTGWRTSGGASGGASPASLNLSADTTLTWTYKKQHHLAVSFASGTPQAVIDAAGATPGPTSANWYDVGASVSPYVTNKVVANGEDYICDRYKLDGGALSTGSTIGGLVMSAPHSVEWSCRRTVSVGISSIGLPDEYKGNAGFSPAQQSGLPVNWSTAPTLSAPMVIYSTNREHKYVLTSWAGTGSIASGSPDIAATDGAIFSRSWTLSAPSSIAWNYSKYVRVKVSASGLATGSADPRECGGINDPTTCVSWANSGSAYAPASGENYYLENSSVVATALYSVVDGAATKTCVSGVVFGATNATPAMVGVRKTVTFTLTTPATVVWLFEQTEQWTVGQPIAPPAGADLTLQPAVEVILKQNTSDPPDNSQMQYFYWGGRSAAGNRQFYPVRPVVSAKLTWQRSGGGAPIVVNGLAAWPATMQTHVVNVPVNLQPASNATLRRYAGIKYTDSGANDSNSTFNAGSAGKSVLLFVDATTANPDANPIHFGVVNSVYWDDPAVLADRGCTVGTAITEATHADPEGKNGWVYFERAYYDGYGADRAHDRGERSGPIIPVNAAKAGESDRQMVVVWYQTAADGVGWPVKPVRYAAAWPAGTPLAIPGDLEAGATAYPDALVYNQPDPEGAGYNPNEEHALIDGGRLWVLRDDLNGVYGISEPVVLLKYRDAGVWAMQAFRVSRGDFGAYPATAGARLSPPFPPSFQKLPQSDIARAGGVARGGPWHHRDRKGDHWAKAANWGPQDALDQTFVKSAITMKWYYPMQSSFYFPGKSEGAALPFLNDGGAARHDYLAGDAPIDVTYVVGWPARDADKVLSAGDTLLTSVKKLPDISYWSSGRVLFDQSVHAGGGPLAKLYAPLRWIKVPVPTLPEGIAHDSAGGLWTFPELPYLLQSRLVYDPVNGQLIFKGAWFSSGGEEPWLAGNIMTGTEKEFLTVTLPARNAAWLPLAGTIGELYRKTRNPNGVGYTGATVTNPYSGATLNTVDWTGIWGIDLGLEQDAAGAIGPVSILGERMALTAGMAQGEGWVTLIAGDDPDQAPADPIEMYVIRVEGPVNQGEIKVIEAANVFDERLTLHFLGDFGGEPEKFVFTWHYQLDNDGNAPFLPTTTDPLPVGTPWLRWSDPADVTGTGLQDITIEGASDLTLADSWFMARYYYGGAYPAPISVAPDPVGASGTSTPPDANNWSRWAGQSDRQYAQLATGWVKRVFSDLNLLDARVKDFRSSETSTIVSMIAQLGGRWEGDIALSSSAENLNQLGLIEAYETVLRRALSFSIEAGSPHSTPATNNALLNATTRLAGFYQALGNEAYADAVDPTIGFSSASSQLNSQYGNLASSVFCFQNQLDSLLEEELVLLRGRDDGMGSMRTRPYYNRLPWNFTEGEGEIAYVQSYNISDQDKNGTLDAADARLMFPQGHGDAWGHYLTALGYYYRLLGHERFDWVPRAEAVQVAGSSVMVDFLDERRFAAIAAAKAKVGAEIVELTYRKHYVDDPSGQWQGYKDTDAARAWGVDEWGRRAAQGALLDWAMANAVLPETATARDRIAPDGGTVPAALIQLIDRAKVPELAEIAGHFAAIQQEIDKADGGLNPLGLAKGVVPFDIDPKQVDAGKTHFEQIYERAATAMANALAVFDYANGYTQLLRRNQDSLEQFRKVLGNQERDYLNRLIEVFGYPYADDIGPGKTYPDGYSGPDWVHFAIVERPDLTGEPLGELREYTTTFRFKPLDAAVSATAQWDASLGVTGAAKSVTFAFDAGNLSPAKPAGWTGKRRAPGEIQLALGELVKSQSSFSRGIEEFQNQLDAIAAAKELLEAKHSLVANAIEIRDRENFKLGTLEDEVRDLNMRIGLCRAGSKVAEKLTAAAIQGIPKMVGLSNDVSAPVRGVLATACVLGNIASEAMAGVYGKQVSDAEATKLAVQRNAEKKLFVLSSSYEVLQLVKELEKQVNLATVRKLELFTLQEAVELARGRYLAAVAKGERLLAEREEKRRTAAADVTEYRYNDLGFRVFRNDALQKYRAQFDLAARYLYLAAMAYDYETNLLGTSASSDAGRRFLTEIVKQRALGVFKGGEPVAGMPGLADSMALLKGNFATYKSLLGFNNPQVETTPFSLRSELFRIRPKASPADADSDRNWRDTLAASKVANLWDVPEFKKYCVPFTDDTSTPQPALVIPFSTHIAFGKGFFQDWDLGGGDSYYSPTHFSTRIRSVGVWFENYDVAYERGLASTPRIYLVPVGADVMRSPTDDGFGTREWVVVDQWLPSLSTVGATNLASATYIPANDSLKGEMGRIRRFSQFAAHPYSGGFVAAEATTDSRLIGRSVWNTRWLLIVPGGALLSDPDEGIRRFLASVDDIRLLFQTNAYSSGF